ncbi:MAG: hypothetical protein ACKPCM_02285, partial [Pseudanabaena sp.]
MLIKDKPEIPPSEDVVHTLETRSITKISTASAAGATSPSKPKVQVWKLPLQVWNNIGVRWKLSLVLLLTAGMPVWVVTQILVKSSEESSLKELRTTVQEKGSFFVSEYVMWTNSESKRDAEAIAKSIENAKLDLSDINDLKAKRSLLQPLLQVSSDGIDPESIKNVKLVTDNTGRSIEGNMIILDEDFSKYPQLASTSKDKDNLVPQQYKQQAAIPSSNLANLPIVKNAITTGNPMYGIELVNFSDLRALGLENQANIGIRPQITKGLNESKQPAPLGTYEIEQGKSGL